MTSATRRPNVRFSPRRRERFLRAANVDYSTLKKNPKAWKEELRERGLWEQMLADGLASK